MSHQSFEVLLVEDNPGDVHLALEAFKSSPTPANVHVVGDGEAALRFLEERLEVQAAGLDLVVLDLNLPRMTGQEVLARMREEKRSEGIPVVVLTSSDREADITESYGLRANCVVTKPVDGRDYMKLVRSIHQHFSRVR
ncbi:MAG: response regulator [Gemmatimonadetes bacterium]|nr:response regulator [Gemmatimonadota bacterium]